MCGGDILQCVGLSRGCVEDVTWVWDVTGLVGRDPDVQGPHVVCGNDTWVCGHVKGLWSVDPDVWNVMKCVWMSRGHVSMSRGCVGCDPDARGRHTSCGYEDVKGLLSRDPVGA